MSVLMLTYVGTKRPVAYLAHGLRPLHSEVGVKQYIVRQLQEVPTGVTLIPDVHFGIYEATTLGNAIAYCRTAEDAERVARLLNSEEWRSEHNQ
jgi:hypothetical protein